VKYLPQIYFSAYFPNLAHPLTSRLYFVTSVYLVNSFAYLFIVVKDEGRTKRGLFFLMIRRPPRSTLSLTTAFDRASVERHGLAVLPSAKRIRTHFTGLGLGRKPGLDRCELSRQYLISIPRLWSP
jgi:hypothetical protein